MRLKHRNCLPMHTIVKDRKRGTIMINLKGKKNLERQCNYLNWNLARLLEISTLL